MSESVQPTTPTENVGRGATFALLCIPIGIAAFVIVAGFFGFITGIVAIAIPFVAQWLYTKGAGAPLTRAGWGPFIAIAGVAVVLGTVAGVIAGAYYSFSKVGGDGGLFGSAFATTVRTQLTTNIADNLVPILIGLGLGFAGIFSVVRGRTNVGRGRGPGPLAQQNMPGGSPSVYPAAVSPMPDVPAAPNGNGTLAPPPPAPNQPSPGVILNGKPIEPDKK